MIRNSRFFFIFLTGLIFFLGTPEGSSPFWYVAPILLAVIWLGGTLFIRSLALFALPLFTALVLRNYLFSSNEYFLIGQFLLLLTSFETEWLFLDSRGSHMERPLILLYPLWIRELISLGIMVLGMFINKKTGLRIGFWPLVFSVLILVFLMKKLFKLPDDKT